MKMNENEIENLSLQISRETNLIKSFANRQLHEIEDLDEETYQKVKKHLKKKVNSRLRLERFTYKELVEISYLYEKKDLSKLKKNENLRKLLIILELGAIEGNEKKIENITKNICCIFEDEN